MIRIFELCFNCKEKKKKVLAIAIILTIIDLFCSIYSKFSVYIKTNLNAIISIMAITSMLICCGYLWSGGTIDNNS